MTAVETLPILAPADLRSDDPRAVRLTSFGFGHLSPGEPPPDATMLLDVRRVLHDPAFDPDLVRLRFTDERVRSHVLATPGAQPLCAHLAELLFVAAQFSQRREPPLVTSLAIGCGGGRHRAPSLVESVGWRLRHQGALVNVVHLHAHLGVLPSSR